MADQGSTMGTQGAHHDAGGSARESPAALISRGEEASLGAPHWIQLQSVL